MIRHQIGNLTAGEARWTRSRTWSHINGQSLIEVNKDGITATGKTDVLWLAQNFETQVMARYVDSYVKVDGRWMFKHREEVGGQRRSARRQ